ncbi:MAG: hypothetical protein ACOYIF_06535 [Acetivibrionales bacterium]
MGSNMMGVLNNLIIFDRQMAIYPKGHSMVERACQNLMASLDVYFSGAKTLELVVVDPSINVNGVEIELNPKQRNALLDIFLKRGLISIAFFSGVSKEQLIQLFSCLQSVPHGSHILYHQDIIKKIDDIGNISVRYMQLGDVQYAENLISGSVLSDESKKVLKLLLYGSGSTQRHFDPAGIEDKLPDNRDNALESYIDLLNEAIYERDTQSLNEMQAFFRSARDILPKMSSDIRNDFLTITFDNLNEGVPEDQLENILNCMPYELLVDLIQMAKDSNREISPAFVQIMNALHPLTTDDYISDHQQVNMTAEQFDKLIDRERYEDYISQDYGHQLTQLSSQSEKEYDASLFTDMSKDYANCFTPAYIDCRLMTTISCLLGGLLAEDTDKVFNNYLKELTLRVARHSKWDVLVKAIPFGGFQSVCRTDEFIQLLEKAYLEESVDTREYLEAIIVNSGEKNLSWILKHYLNTNDPEEEDRLLSLLLKFGTTTASRTIGELNHISINSLNKIIRIMQACHIQLSREQMGLLLTSEDMEVQFRGIQLLMEQDSQQVYKELQRRLKDKNGNMRVLTLKFIGMNRYTQVIPLLLKCLSVFYINENKFLFNCEIINTLHTLAPEALQMAADRVLGFKISLTPKRIKETQQYLRRLLS